MSPEEVAEILRQFDENFEYENFPVLNAQIEEFVSGKYQENYDLQMRENPYHYVRYVLETYLPETDISQWIDVLYE